MTLRAQPSLYARVLRSFMFYVKMQAKVFRRPLKNGNMPNVEGFFLEKPIRSGNIWRNAGGLAACGGKGSAA